MAQHYLVRDKEILKSITKVIPKVFNDIKLNRLDTWSYDGKQIEHLPEDYNPNGYAFLIKPYNMADIFEHEEYAEEKACLEVHLDTLGHITEIYYAL